MDDRLIEQKLRDSYDPEPPAGMRERVLGRAREAERGRGRVLWFPNWRVALATVGVLVVLLANLSDYARGVRLAAVTGSRSAPTSHGMSIQERARQIDCLLAYSRTDCREGREPGGSM